MRIYLAAAMTNAARDLATIRALVDHLEAEGHDVPTRHVADASGREPESAITHAEVARRDLAWVAGSDALIAEVSTPSHGVGVEVASATARGVPTLLVHRAGVPVSRLLLGLPGIEVADYADVTQARARVSAFLARVGAARAAARG